MNIMMTIEYDGTNFYGFEIQPQKRTIRGKFESAVKSVTGEDVRINCGGRTDKGVHALSQVINFHTETKLSPAELKRAVNANLPRDIHVKDAVKTNDKFHARYSAKARVYLYRLLMDESPLRRNYVGHYRFRFDMDSLKEILDFFCGSHDFKRFSKRDSGICNIIRFELSKNGDEFHFEIEGNRFLHKQVRMIIGTVLLYARGKLDKRTIIAMLDGEEGKTAIVPACGLYLKKVVY